MLPILPLHRLEEEPLRRAVRTTLESPGPVGAMDAMQQDDQRHVLQGRGLLGLARRAVLAALEGAPPPGPGQLAERLQAPQGAFVTLHVAGRLRGCIGMIEPVAARRIKLVGFDVDGVFTTTDLQDDDSAEDYQRTCVS